jgi:hypothetical protein
VRIIRWRTLSDERTELYSPIGLRVVDEITGEGPIGWIRSYLEASDGAGGWRKTDVPAVFTLSGVITYPALERSADPLLPPRRYRVRVEAEFYLPLYRATRDAVEFDAFPYDDLHPPQNFSQIKATQPRNLILTPQPHYPFPGHIPVVRGIVKDPAGVSVSDATVSQGGKERVLTDSGGHFALPLRWAATNTQVIIDATDQRSNLAGSITIQFPQDLKKSQTIVVQ